MGLSREGAEMGLEPRAHLALWTPSCVLRGKRPLLGLLCPEKEPWEAPPASLLSGGW